MTTRTLGTADRRARTGARGIAVNPPSSTLPVYITHLIQRYARTGTIWALAFGIYTAVIVLAFPSFAESGAFDAIENYPDALKEAFNFQDMSTIEAFLGAEIYSYAPLVLAFFPIMAFSGAIAGAEERSQLDILLGTPLPRRHLVLSTWIAVTIVLFAVLVAVGLLSWLASLLVDAGLSLGAAMRAALGVFPPALAFGSLALLLSTLMRQRGLVIGASFGVMFLMYLLEVMGKIVPEYGWVRWFSAFRYYGNPIVDGFSWGNAAVLVAASVVMLALAIPAFERRDIYT